MEYCFNVVLVRVKNKLGNSSDLSSIWVHNRLAIIFLTMEWITGTTFWTFITQLARNVETLLRLYTTQYQRKRELALLTIPVRQTLRLNFESWTLLWRHWSCVSRKIKSVVSLWFAIIFYQRSVEVPPVFGCTLPRLRYKSEYESLPKQERINPPSCSCSFFCPTDMGNVNECPCLFASNKLSFCRSHCIIPMRKLSVEIW